MRLRNPLLLLAGCLLASCGALGQSGANDPYYVVETSGGA